MFQRGIFPAVDRFGTGSTTFTGLGGTPATGPPPFKPGQR